jgi:hypothetical protein
VADGPGEDLSAAVEGIPAIRLAGEQPARPSTPTSLTGVWLARPVSEKDDVVALLNAELARVASSLERLEGAGQAEQARLDDIGAELEKGRLVREILQLEEKERILEQIQASQLSRPRARVR